MKKKLYKILYTMTCQEDIIYFSAANLAEVVDILDVNRELHSIVYLGEIEILNQKGQKHGT